MSLSGCGLIIAGATGGIGSALARLAASEGARLALVARDSDRLSALSSELGATSVSADVRNPSSVNSAFAAARETLGEVHGVAHCVGSILIKPPTSVCDEEWDATLALNLTSAFYVLRAALPLLTPPASLAFCTSAAATIGLANHEAVGAAKAGLIGMVQSAAATYARRGIRVNAVAPGLVRTPLAEQLVTSEAALAASRSLHPVGRIGEPDEIARGLAFLLDPAQSWITGHILAIDGGLASLKTRG